MAGSTSQAEGSKAPHQSGGDSSTARKTFELNNDVQMIDPTDSLFAYTRAEETVLEDANPWKKEYVYGQNQELIVSPHYFHTVKISAVALIKMVSHPSSTLSELIVRSPMLDLEVPTKSWVSCMERLGMGHSG